MTTRPGNELLYFWAIGDLHYNTPPQWRTYHAQRLAPMFRDLRALWSQEGTPALGQHPVTYINLMSPWFTGYEKEPGRDAASNSFEFFIDEPDVVVSFAFQVYRNYVTVRLRNHRESQWMAHWRVPL